MPRRKQKLPVPPVELRPLGSRVLVRALKADATAEKFGSLYLPQSAADWQTYGQWEVVACGPDVVEEALLPGARVIVARFTSTPVEWHGETVAFVAEENITAVLLL